jgi:putative holliday junction resolvase
MRVLGIDLGERRIGVAVSDRTGVLASPLCVLDRSPKVYDEIRKIVDEEEAEAVVVGLPVRLDGRDGPAAGKAREEAAALGEALGVPVHLSDERLTSVAANNRMAEAGRNSRARRGRVDAAAAAMLLQTWLDKEGLRGS